MQKWAKNWSQQIKKSTLRDHEARTAMNITIMKKLEYPLVAVTLTRKQCDKIMSTLVTTSLSKAGYNHNFPRKAVHGPPSLMGGGVHHIYATMVAKHAQEMMTEAPHDSPTGQLIRTSIEQAKLELGLEGRLFDHDFKAVGNLITECWIKNVWKETSEYGLCIIEQTTSLKTECEGEKMLMEAFVHNGYKGNDLRDLNKCRLYLQCTNLADITNGKGDKILAAVLPISIDRTKTVRVANTTSPKSTTEIALEESTAQMLCPTSQNHCSATTIGLVVLTPQSSYQIRP
jgi:hypothetical protein